MVIDEVTDLAVRIGVVGATPTYRNSAPARPSSTSSSKSPVEAFEGGRCVALSAPNRRYSLSEHKGNSLPDGDLRSYSSAARFGASWAHMAP